MRTQVAAALLASASLAAAAEQYSQHDRNRPAPKVVAPGAAVSAPAPADAIVDGQFPPLVNVSRAPGEWTAYDVVFRAPRFDRDGKLLKAAWVTAFQNRVLIQDAQELLGPTTNKVRTPYSAHADKLPLGLQDHGHPVRFRNVWIRELAE